MKQITILTALMLITANAIAQNNVKRTMEALINNSNVKKVMTSNYDDSDKGGSITTYCYFTELYFTKDQQRMINRLEDAFEQDAAKGYKYIHQTPEIKAEKSNVVYGPNFKYNVAFCTRPTHNYRLLFVNDENNATKRYVYAMVWYKEGKGTRCLLYRIYGDNPAKVTKLPAIAENIVPPTPPITSSTMTILDENGIRIITNKDENGKVISTIKTTKDANGIAIGTSAIHRFGNLRIAFLEAIKNQDQKSLQTGIVMNIVELCKKHSNEFSQNERNTCKTSINEMQNIMKKTNPDTFLNGMLDEAYQSLGR
ncbi:hypothetical protein E5358_09230 [Palleniella muris]|uniref:Uncharacterized protein n=1 Tax=Palleniella muris TaxID=3038145 RepID=A0AC61QPH9_9BACT|nr:hypothetical protein [Palleniella muris]TGX81704.1 hypothetical protein E5358_09230 [Palleniella muris]